MTEIMDYECDESDDTVETEAISGCESESFSFETVEIKTVEHYVPERISCYITKKRKPCCEKTNIKSKLWTIICIGIVAASALILFLALKGGFYG